MPDRWSMMLGSMSDVVKVPMTLNVVRKILAASPTRIAILFGTGVNGNLHVSLDPGMASNEGISLANGRSPYSLNIWDHGEMVRRDWYGWSDTSETLTIIETFAGPQ